MSTICKYYMRGNCKYGHRCHFLHEDPYDRSYSYSRSQDKYASQQSYGDYYKSNNSRYYGENYEEDYSRNHDRNRYSQQNHGGNYSHNHHSNSRSNYANDNYASKQSHNYNRYHVDNRNSQRETKNPESISPIEFLEIVNFELTQHERSRSWPFSVIAPVKEFGNIPGFKDCSPEEVRFQYIESLSTNSLFEYEKNIREAQAEIEKYRQIFRSKSSEAINILRTMMQQSKTSESSNTSSSFTPTTSSFTFDVRKLHETQSTENMEPSVFSNASFNTPNQTCNQLFTNPSTFSTNEMSQIAFSEQPTVAFSADNGMFNQFQSQPSMNNFSFNLNCFNSGQPNSVAPIVDDTTYSNQESLPPEILESFQAKAFKVGNVPFVPPPRQLCFSLS